MLIGIILLWFLLTALSLLFVALDIRAAPASPVLKWGFILLTVYNRPLGAFLYVLGSRQPPPGLRERHVAARWRQVPGSTMHCVPDDGVGILVGAVIASLLHFGQVTDIAREYALGFAFGWSIFQALFMRGMSGSSYKRSLTSTFFPELLSMNYLMAGIVPAMTLAIKAVPGNREPSRPEFWFVMSMARLVGFVNAYPMNWWRVSRHLKHSMMTVGPPGDPLSGGGASAGLHDDHASTGHAGKAQPKGNPSMGSDCRLSIQRRPSRNDAAFAYSTWDWTADRRLWWRLMSHFYKRFAERRATTAFSICTQGMR